MKELIKEYKIKAIEYINQIRPDLTLNGLNKPYKDEILPFSNERNNIVAINFNEGTVGIIIERKFVFRFNDKTEQVVEHFGLEITKNKEKGLITFKVINS